MDNVVFLITWCPWICNYPNVFFGDYHWNAKRPEVHGLPFNHNLKTCSTGTKAYQFCITQVFCLLGVNVSTAIIVEQWEPQVWTCSTCLEAFAGSDTNVNRYNIVEMYNKHIVETRKPGTVYRCTFWLSVKPFKFTFTSKCSNQNASGWVILVAIVSVFVGSGLLDRGSVLHMSVPMCAWACFLDVSTTHK